MLQRALQLIMNRSWSWTLIALLHWLDYKTLQLLLLYPVRLHTGHRVQIVGLGLETVYGIDPRLLFKRFDVTLSTDSSRKRPVSIKVCCEYGQ